MAGFTLVNLLSKKRDSTENFTNLKEKLLPNNRCLNKYILIL